MIMFILRKGDFYSHFIISQVFFLSMTKSIPFRYLVKYCSYNLTILSYVDNDNKQFKTDTQSANDLWPVV